MVRTQLLVAFVLLGLQLGMHGAQARRNPHTDHDLMPGRCLEAAVGGAETQPHCCCFWPASLAELPSMCFPGYCCCMQVGWAVTISLLTSVYMVCQLEPGACGYVCTADSQHSGGLRAQQHMVCQTAAPVSATCTCQAQRAIIISQVVLNWDAPIRAGCPLFPIGDAASSTLSAVGQHPRRALAINSINHELLTSSSSSKTQIRHHDRPKHLSTHVNG